MINQIMVDVEQKKMIFRLDSDKVTNLKVIAARKHTTLNDLICEGVDQILEKYKKFLSN